MKKIILALAFMLLLAGCGGNSKATHVLSCPDCQAAGQKTANIWKELSDSPVRKCSLVWGEKVEIVSMQPEWLHIKGPGCDGWIKPTMVKPIL